MAIPRNLANIAPHVNASSTEVVVNDGGANLDFRVEGDTNANMLFVDASADAVGIGTSSPSRQLVVYGSSPYLALQNSTTGSSESDGFQIQASGNNAYVWNYEDSFIAFGTNATERARITSAGALYIGTSSPPGGSKLAVLESTDSPVTSYFENTNASFSSIVMAVNATRNTTNGTYTFISCSISNVAQKFRVLDSGNVQNANNSYGSISDVKLKQDIVDAGSQWDDIKGLRVRKYRLKSEPEGFMQIGLVAQEAEEVSPGLVEEHHDYEEVEVPVLDDDGNAVLNEDGTPQVTKERNDLGTTTKAIKYSVLYMKAVKALQEAMERIETLEAKVAALEAQ